LSHAFYFHFDFLKQIAKGEVNWATWLVLHVSKNAYIVDWSNDAENSALSSQE